MKCMTGNRIVKCSRLTLMISAVTVVGLTNNVRASDMSSRVQPAEQKQSEVITPEAHKFWTVIRNAKGKRSVNFDESYEESLGEFWLETHMVAFATFSKMVDGPNRRENLKYFVEQFGKHGPQADMRWLLARPGTTLSQSTGDDGGLYGVSSVRSRKARDVQVLFAELQVRHILSDREALERYYHAVVWYGSFFRFFAHNIGVMQQKFSEKPDAEYWWYARNFVVFAHATGRDDLLRDVKPEKLHARYIKWIHWIASNGPYFRASQSESRWYLDEGEKKRQEGYLPFVSRSRLPKLIKQPSKPFPDWTGPPALRPKDLRQLASTGSPINKVNWEFASQPVFPILPLTSGQRGIGVRGLDLLFGFR